MSWNYRIVKQTFPPSGPDGEIHEDYAIHEVYYDDDGNPESLSAEPAKAVGNDLNDLRNEFENMSAALSQPVLNYEDFFE